MIDVTAIILTGGLSTRMGRDKAFLNMDGELLIEIMLKKVSAFNEVIIVTNNPEKFSFLNERIVTDIKQNCGPLGGIHAGLLNAQFDKSLILACDMPFISTELLQYMAKGKEKYDVVAPIINGFYQPLCAIYNSKCLPAIEKKLINREYKIKDLFRLLKVRYIKEQELALFGETNTMFKNINCQEDYFDALIALYENNYTNRLLTGEYVI